MALCNVTGTVYLPNGQLARSRTIVFKRADKRVTAEYLGTVLPDDVLAQTGTTGQIAVSLLTGVYAVHTEGGYIGNAVVPSESSADFADLIAGRVLPSQISVSGDADVTQFTRSGVDYTQIAWRSGGGMTVSKPVAAARLAVVGGGASGGRAAGTGSSPGGGAGSYPVVVGTAGTYTLSSGAWSFVIGAGGATPSGTNGRGVNGSDSVASLSGVEMYRSVGGGGGGGNTSGQNVGADGGNGGGGMGGASLSAAGGASTSGGYAGGSGYAGTNAADRTGGGGGGGAGAGADGTSAVGGSGGVGLTLDWAEPPLGVCGGGGGSGATNGSATHGGTSGAIAATNGGGSGGVRGGAANGAGGSGIVVLVFPTDNAEVVI